MKKYGIKHFDTGRYLPGICYGSFQEMHEILQKHSGESDMDICEQVEDLYDLGLEMGEIPESRWEEVEGGVFYAVYDSQIKGFKARLVATSKRVALDHALDRLDSIHEPDMSVEEQRKLTQMYEGLYNDDEKEAFVAEYDYEIKPVSLKEYFAILGSDAIGLVTSVDLDKLSPIYALAYKKLMPLVKVPNTEEN